MMKKVIGVLLLALLTTLVWTYEIPAASWDFIYECGITSKSNQEG